METTTYLFQSTEQPTAATHLQPQVRDPRTPICHRVRIPWLAALLLLIAAWMPAQSALAEEAPPQAVAIGDTIPDITLRNFYTGEEVRRDDFAGGILVFDFFAHWCGTCYVSTPTVVEEIEDYYADRGGNPAGIPVYVISVDVSGSSPDKTRRFIEMIGLDSAFEDIGSPTLKEVLPEAGVFPFFAVVNGVAGDPEHSQWELLAFWRGFKSAQSAGGLANILRPVIDSIVQSTNSITDEPTIYREPKDWVRLVGETVSFSVAATGKQPQTIQWYKDGKAIPGATQSRYEIAPVTLEDAGTYHAEIQNDFGKATSHVAHLTVNQTFRDWIRRQGLTGNDLDKAADPDQDGQANLAEFLQSTDPTDPEDRYIPPITVTVDETGSVANVQFRVNPGAWNVAYEIQTSHDLETWDTLDLDSDQIAETHLGSVLIINVSLPTDVDTAKFFRLRVTDLQPTVGIQVDQTIAGGLTEDDEVDPYYLENFGEFYYLDKYNLEGLIDGKEYTVTFSSPNKSLKEPWLDLIDPVSGDVISSVSYNSSKDSEEGEGAANFAFIADAERHYLITATTYDERDLGQYNISLRQTDTLVDLTLNQPVEGILDPASDAFLEEGTPEDTYLLKNLPAGKELSITVRTVAGLQTFDPEINIMAATTREDYFTVSKVTVLDGEGIVETRFEFVPEAGTDYLVAVRAQVGEGESVENELHYKIQIEEADFIPAIRPGDSVSGTVSKDAIWTFDEVGYYVSFYELTDVTFDELVDIEVSSSVAEDMRIFIVDAASWELLFKDLATQTGETKSTSIAPQQGKHYFIGAGVPERSADTTYTLRITQ